MLKSNINILYKEKCITNNRKLNNKMLMFAFSGRKQDDCIQINTFLLYSNFIE